MVESLPFTKTPRRPGGTRDFQALTKKNYLSGINALFNAMTLCPEEFRALG
jgi:hypothetical protein